MFGFAAPLWLAALAALLVPITLHLWSRRTGRAVRVGSIRLLSGAPPAMARRPRLHDPWLLALRCALLTALVLALASPYWAPRRPAAPVWALVATDVRGRAELVDSLSKSGRTVRPLDPGDLWMSLTIADRAAPPGTRFEVYATPLLSGTRGTRPLLRSSVVWYARASTRGQSKSTPLSPASRGRLVTVFADAGHSDDARYVTAALRAAGIVSGIPAIVTTRAAATADSMSVVSVDWIVWLSGQPVPDVVRRRLQAGATLLTDVAPPTPALTRAAFERNALAPVWTSVAGAPQLTFGPTWRDFVLDPGFPEAMARLWIGADSTRLDRDDRPIALSQVMPAHNAAPDQEPARTGAQSLFVPLWLIAVVLFLLERRIANRSTAR